MPRIIIVILALVCLLSVPAVAVDITFQVRMQHQITLGHFDPAQDFVDVAGSFNGWGTDPLTTLADADGDTVFAVTLDGFVAGEEIEFKFRINGQWDGSEEFPGGGPNRQYIVQAAGNEILVWYGDVEPPEVSLDELGWWNDAVFYEVFVRSFQDSDGDGIGDLVGLRQRLDDLNDGDPTTDTDLGVTALWLMPINDSPSYHGYDATDYRAFNPDYGTLADFQDLLDAAHARGIKVIIDYVMNHCSTQHPWFEAAGAQSPTYRDWFRWSSHDPGQTGPWGQDVWHWHNSGWYYGLFWGGMPDLNYEHPPVKQEMFDTATYWLDTVGVDGFRLDAILYIHEDGDQLENTAATFQFWQDFGAHVRSVSPEALTVGEAWTSSNTVVEYVRDQRLDICFEFDLAGTIVGGVNGAWAQGVADKALEASTLYPYLQFGTFLTNHDQDRAFTQLGRDEGRARAAAGIYLGLPGVPFVYYGEEIGMTGSGAHENIRTPMQWDGGEGAGFTSGTPWHPINGDYPTRNVVDQRQDPESLWNWYRRCIAARQASPALRRGEHLPLECSSSSVLAFARRYGGETVLCLANTAGWAQTDLVVSGAGLPVGTHDLVDLIDGNDNPTVTVGDDHTLAGLSLQGHEVRWFRFGELVSAPDDLPAALTATLVGYPNPFNPTVSLIATVPAAGPVRLEVYDLAGRRVATLVDQALAAGRHVTTWDGQDTAGRPLGAGTYLARLDCAGRVTTCKLSLCK